MNVIHCIALKIHRLRDSKYPHVSRLLQYTVEFLFLHPLAENVKSNPTRVYHPHGFHQTLLKSATNSHDLANGFHRRANLTIDLSRELSQVPFRDFGHDIIKGGFETRGRGQS